MNSVIELITATDSRYLLHKHLIRNLIQNRNYYRTCPGKHEGHYRHYNWKSQNHRSQERAANAQKQVGGDLSNTCLAFFLYLG